MRTFLLLARDEASWRLEELLEVASWYLKRGLRLATAFVGLSVFFAIAWILCIGACALVAYALVSALLWLAQ